MINLESGCVVFYTHPMGGMHMGGNVYIDVDGERHTIELAVGDQAHGLHVTPGSQFELMCTMAAEQINEAIKSARYRKAPRPVAD